MLTEIPPEAMVPDALVPAKAAVACTKSEPRFEAIAVVSALCDPVTVLPFRPKLIPFELEKTTLSRLPLVVPALKFTDDAQAAATLAVTMLPALVPKVTLLALLKPRV